MSAILIKITMIITLAIIMKPYYDTSDKSSTISHSALMWPMNAPHWYLLQTIKHTHTLSDLPFPTEPLVRATVCVAMVTKYSSNALVLPGEHLWHVCVCVCPDKKHRYIVGMCTLLPPLCSSQQQWPLQCTLCPRAQTRWRHHTGINARWVGRL